MPAIAMGKVVVLLGRFERGGGFLKLEIQCNTARSAYQLGTGSLAAMLDVQDKM